MILGVVVVLIAAAGTVSCVTGAAGSTYEGVRVTVVTCDADVPEDFPVLVLPVEYKSFLCAPAVIVTAINAINNTDFFITVCFIGFFPMQK